MKSPHCPSCGKSHWSTQRCSAKETGLSGQEAKQRNTSVAPVDLDSPDSPGRNSAESARFLGNARSRTVLISTAPPVSLAGTSTSSGSTTLTNAARCKKHREKKGDAYREANKLRMRKKRDG